MTGSIQPNGAQQSTGTHQSTESMSPESNQTNDSNDSDESTFSHPDIDNLINEVFVRTEPLTDLQFVQDLSTRTTQLIHDIIHVIHVHKLSTEDSLKMSSVAIEELASIVNRCHEQIKRESEQLRYVSQTMSFFSQLTAKSAIAVAEKKKTNKKTYASAFEQYQECLKKARELEAINTTLRETIAQYEQDTQILRNVNNVTVNVKANNVSKISVKR